MDRDQLPNRHNNCITGLTGLNPGLYEVRATIYVGRDGKQHLYYRRVDYVGEFSIPGALSVVEQTKEGALSVHEDHS